MILCLRRQSGFSLIELSIVLTIVGVVVGAIWLYASRVNENNRANQFANQATQIMVKTREVFARSGGQINISQLRAMTDAAVQAGIFPAEMIRTGEDNPINVYGGDTFLGHRLGAPPYFRLTFDNIEEAGCLAFLTKTIRNADIRRQFGIIAVSANQSATALVADPQSLARNNDLSTAEIVNICQVSMSDARRSERFAITIDFRYF